MEPVAGADKKDKLSWLWWTLLAAIFVAPVFVHLDFENDRTLPRLQLVTPHVLSGDEPHYMVMVSSLVLDGDLAIDNNYERAYKQHTWDAGEFHAGSELYFKGHMAGPTQPWHWPGMPLLISALVWPLAHTRYLEAAAVLLSTVAGLLGLVAVALVLRHLEPRRVLRTVAVIAFATPVWHYSGRMFTEIYLFALLAWAVYFGFVRSRWMTAGAILAAGVTINVPFLVPGGAIGLWLLYRRQWRTAVRYAIPFFVVGLLFVAYLFYLFGSPFGHGAAAVAGKAEPDGVNRAFEFKFFALRHLAKDAVYILFSGEHGLFLFSPVLIASLWGIAPCVRRRPFDGLVWVVAIFYVFFCLYMGWWGGYSYGTRYFVMVQPIFAVWLHLMWPGIRRRFWQVVVALLAAVSIFTNAQAALAPGRFFSAPPWTLIYLPSSEVVEGKLFTPMWFEARGGDYTEEGTIATKVSEIRRSKYGPHRRNAPLRLFSPYAHFAPGTYEARFWLRYPGGGKVFLGVFRRTQRKSIAALTLTSRSKGFDVATVRFKTEEPYSSRFLPYRWQPLRFFLRADGDADIEFQKLEVVRVGD